MAVLEYIYIMYPPKALFRTGAIAHGLGKQDLPRLELRSPESKKSQAQEHVCSTPVMCTPTVRWEAENGEFLDAHRKAGLGYTRLINKETRLKQDGRQGPMTGLFSDLHMQP